MGFVVKFCCLVLYLLAMVVVWPITQLIVSKSSMELPYSVVYPCSTNNAMWVNDATIHLPGPFSAKLKAYETTLSIERVNGQGQYVKIALGKSRFPEMSLSPGKNNVDFQAAMDLQDVNSLKENFLQPMQEGKTVKLFLDVPKFSLDVFGLLPVPLLHMHRELSCSGTKTTAPKDIPASICHGAATGIHRSLKRRQKTWRR